MIKNAPKWMKVTFSAIFILWLLAVFVPEIGTGFREVMNAGGKVLPAVGNAFVESSVWSKREIFDPVGDQLSERFRD